MQVQYASDLHLEFAENAFYLKKNPLIPTAPTLVLAGDVLPFARLDRHADFFNYLSDHFEMTYWLPGNHEYYGTDLSSRSGRLQEKIRENIWLVNNTTVDQGPVRLVFSTLWSKISVRHEWQIAGQLNDFRQIRNGRERLQVSQYNALHEESLAFIQETVSEAAGQRLALFTHHCPSFKNYPPPYKGDPFNEAFATECSPLIENAPISCWIYGHHHYPTPAFKIGNTWLLNNQLGYVQFNEHLGFQPDRCVVC